MNIGFYMNCWIGTLFFIFSVQQIAASPLGDQYSGDLKSGGNSTGEFRGYDSINEVMKVRLIDPTYMSGRNFDLGMFFGDRFGRLSMLLGRFDGGSFRNGAPNSMNMLIWYLGFSTFSNTIAKCVCDEQTAILPGNFWKMTEHAYETLGLACKPIEDPVQKKAVLLKIWLEVLGYDVPQAEFEAWSTALGSSHVGGGSDWLAELLTAAFLT